MPAAVVMSLLLPSSAAAPTDVEPLAHWAQNGCDHGYSVKSARRGVRANLRAPVAHQRRAKRFVRCTRSERSERAVKRTFIRWIRWRRSYTGRWRLAWERLLSYDQAWAESTGACESGNNPRTSTGNGFYGAFQWVLSTWYAAGGDRFPTLASWHHQAVLAVRWRNVAGRGQWPVCG